MFAANRSFKKQAFLIIIGIAVAILVSINLTSASDLNSEKIASLINGRDYVNGHSESAETELIIVYDVSYAEIFKIEVDEESKKSNVHLNRFLARCDFLVKSENTLIYLFNK